MQNAGDERQRVGVHGVVVKMADAGEKPEDQLMSDPPRSKPVQLDYGPPKPKRRGWLFVAVGVAIGLFVFFLIAGLMLPSITRSRPVANQVKCASNLRQIGQAILLYSQDHDGQYPDDFATLLLTEDITSEVFVCPFHTTPPPLVRRRRRSQQT